MIKAQAPPHEQQAVESHRALTWFNALLSVLIVLTISNKGPAFHFALDPANYVASPVETLKEVHKSKNCWSSRLPILLSE